MTSTTNGGGNAIVTLPADDQILITREFAAPRHLVYRAWTTPELVKRWWAGQRGKMTSVEIDLRVGGRWRYVMDVNEGGEVAFHGEYREIVPGERIVYTETLDMPGVPDGPGDAPVNTATFTERDGRTTLTLLTQCKDRELRDMILASGMEGGMQEAWDLLEELAVSLA
ncbi:SRPBCC family protein [Bailinhaonella thermotolerans]|uniref:ATPase n=1 Tax=Bailinhaonella thermotolerans TaxID=1070861 RepID=A0A3A4BBD1_9ACTN|nr:SRPBCC family protein [Bailinhaonella thermotolerans]RJL35406.1 ATPase [Bailinhaonella thermotolerans]